MGRSVSYLSNAETIIYFTIELNENDEKGEYDEFLSEINWDDFKTNLECEIRAKLKSYYRVENKWDGRETKIILENSLCEIGLSEYCGLFSLSVREKESEYSDSQYKMNLGQNHARKVENTLIKCLMNSGAEVLNRVGTFSNGTGVFTKKNEYLENNCPLGVNVK